MTIQQRASRDEILDHLRQRLGRDAVAIVTQVTHLYQNGRGAEGLQMLLTYDADLGGIGIYCASPNTKLPGVHRALAYVGMCLRDPTNAVNFTRYVVSSSGAYLEELLKKMVRQGFFEKLTSDRLPLGALVRKARKTLPPALYQDLDWLAQKVHNYAKHGYNFEDAEGGEPEHAFGLDEALAAYLLARYLGLQLERIIEERGG